jgi:hypothetical protein
MAEGTSDLSTGRRGVLRLLGAGAAGAGLFSGVGTAVSDLRVIAYGETKSGEITTDDPSDDYYAGTNYAEPVTFQASAGDRVRVEMRSKALDSFVRVAGPDGSTVATDPDGDASADSTVEVTLSTAGGYTIWAQSVSGTDTGAYTLSLTLLDGTDGGDDGTDGGDDGTDGGDDGTDGGDDGTDSGDDGTDGDDGSDGGTDDPLGPREIAASLVPAEPEVTPDGSLTVAIEVTGAVDGIRSYDVTVRSTATGVASITSASTAGSSGFPDVDVAEDGSSARIKKVNANVDGTAEAAEIANVSIEPVALGTADLTLEVATVGDPANQAYTVARTSGATVSVVEETTPSGPVVVGDDPATDVDGDGTYEDVNGDGQATILDVSDFLDAYDGETVAANEAKFDFNNDGRVSILDVSTLLEQF